MGLENGEEIVGGGEVYRDTLLRYLYLIYLFLI